jgi:methenyltetrahydrofolate cyclohydrolase
LASSDRDSFLDLTVKELLDAVPARSPAPGGGAVTALVAALAGGLVAMAARFAPDSWERRAEVVGRAEELRAAVEPLADADAAAYAAFMAARTDETVERIVALPFEVVELATELAELGALVAREGNPTVHGDASAGADLAAAAATAAARLVRVNAPADERTARAAELARAAAAAAARADSADEGRVPGTVPGARPSPT